MTDVTVTSPTFTLGDISIPSPRVTGRAKSVNLDFIDTEGLTINEVHFESVFPGEMPLEKEITITNGGTGNVNLTLQSIASVINPLGSGLDTYLSTFFSLDQVTYANTLDVTVNSGGTETFYIKYLPPSTAMPGEKEWTFNPIINDTESGAPPGWENYRDWLYYDYFTITGEGNETPYPIEKIITYSAGIMNPDFSDIRFVNEEGEELGYYILSKTDEDTATFWMDTPIPLEDETVTIYVYSGNPNALSQSNMDHASQWTDEWTLNDTDYPHDSTYDDGEFNIENQRIVLCDGNNQGGNAVNINAIRDSFIFQGDVDLGYQTFAFFFYLSDINNYIIVQRLKRVSFDHYWEIGKVVNGTYTSLASNYGAPYDSAYYTGLIRVEVVKNTSIKIYQGATLKLEYIGTFPQSGNEYGFWAANSYWSGNYGRCYIDQPLFSLNGNFSFPTISSLTGTWKFVSKNLEIKAGLSFRSRYLPGVTPIVKHSVRIGGYVYD